MTDRAYLVAFTLGLACSLDKQDDVTEAATSSDASASASNSGPSEAATCTELLAAAPGTDHIVDSYWLCLYICEISQGDDDGDSRDQALESYDALEPGKPDVCFELRTAVYECLADLTCNELDIWTHATDPMGPCQPEYAALDPHIESCGI